MKKIQRIYTTALMIAEDPNMVRIFWEYFLSLITLKIAVTVMNPDGDLSYKRNIVFTLLIINMYIMFHQVSLWLSAYYEYYPGDDGPMSDEHARSADETLRMLMPAYGRYWDWRIRRTVSFLAHSLLLIGLWVYDTSPMIVLWMVVLVFHKILRDSTERMCYSLIKRFNGGQIDESLSITKVNPVRSEQQRISRADRACGLRSPFNPPEETSDMGGRTGSRFLRILFKWK